MRQGQGSGAAEAIEPQLIRLIKARLSKRWFCDKIKRSPLTNMPSLFTGDDQPYANDAWFRMYLRYRADRRRVMILTYNPTAASTTPVKDPPRPIFSAAIKQKKKKKFYYNLRKIDAGEFNDFMKLEEQADREINVAVERPVPTQLSKEA